jgi:hypothetical protein
MPRTGQRRRRAAIGLAVLCAAAALMPAPARAQAGNAARGVEIAADERRLPDTPLPVAPLRRRDDGQIEILTPQNRKNPCSAGAICVGKGRAYATLEAALAAAHDGDVIEIVAGTYHEKNRIELRNLILRGVAGRPHFDCAGLDLGDDKACLMLAADGIALIGLEISGATASAGDGGDGACIRNETDLSFTVRRVTCHGSQAGIIADGGTILIEESEFFDNGWTDNLQNVSLGGKCSVTVRASIFRDARIGDEFRSRCRKTAIADSSFRSTTGAQDIDLPVGGETLVYRSTLMKGANAESEIILGFAGESCVTLSDLTLKEVRIVNSHPNAAIENFGKCDGRAIVLQGVQAEGLPVREIGYIYAR